MREIVKTFKHPRKDLPAGFVVFLVALPLCLGIALASNAPMTSGIVSGAIAGLVVAWISGSNLSVSGPSAGLTLTLTAAIDRLGSFNAVLVATVLAGLIQFVLGLARAGVLASFFPHSVIKGMLAAIGLIIVLKQIPHALGWDADFVGDENYAQAMDQENTFSEIYKAFDRMDIGAIYITLVAFVFLLLWNHRFVKNHKYLSLVPAPLVAVLSGVLTNEFLLFFTPNLGLAIGGEHMVAISEVGGVSGFFNALPKPDWSIVGQSATWEIALTIAIIASIESLLSLEACDRIDPERRNSDSNRELIAQGVGNMLSGAMGGIPMTSAIVRSSANIYAGAKTRLACFTHSVCLLSAVIAIPAVLNRIPLAALAAVLISVGFKLVSFDVIKKVTKSGFEQALPFFVTLIAIVLSGLLTGVGIGLVVGLLIVFRMNHHSAITVVSEGNTYLVRFAKDVSFTHKPALKKILSSLPDSIRVTIDGTGAQFIDHDILEAVNDFYQTANNRGIDVILKNLRTKRMSRWGKVKHGRLQEPVIG